MNVKFKDTVFICASALLALLLVSPAVRAQTLPAASLGWTDNSSNEDGFGIYRCSGAACDPAAKIAETGPNITTYLDSGLAQAAPYCWAVDAFINVVGRSAKTAPACLTTPAQLTLSKLGGGTGTITSSPAGVTCGTTCSGWFAAIGIITLTAQASATSQFGGWGGACSGSGPCSVAMSGAKLVTATFNLISVPAPPTNLTVK